MKELSKDDFLSLPPKEQIEVLEGVLLQYPQVEVPDRKIISNGIFCKEILIPRGSIAIGHAHTEGFMEVVSMGSMVMYTPGQEPVIVKAPYTGIGMPGYRKVGYALEDTIWSTFHRTSETDPEKAEDQLIVKSQTFLEYQRLLDNQDYKMVLAEHGFTEVVAREQSENKDDRTPFPKGSYPVKVSDSDIDGRGLFATGDIRCGSVIAPARISGKRTPAGRYTNHSKKPNAIMRQGDNIISLVAIKHISGGEEITVDYRESLKLSGVKKCQQ